MRVFTDRGRECKVNCPARVDQRCPGAVVCQGNETLVAVPDPDSPDGLKVIGVVRGRQSLVDLLVSLQPKSSDDHE